MTGAKWRVYARRINEGKPTPWWDDRPVLPESVGWVKRAFDALTTTRGIGMTVGPIPWTAVDRYAERYGLDGDGFERLQVWIRMMDHAAREKDRPIPDTDASGTQS